MSLVIHSFPTDRVLTKMRKNHKSLNTRVVKIQNSKPGLCTFLHRTLLFYSWFSMIFNQNGIEFDLWLGAKNPPQNVKTHLVSSFDHTSLSKYHINDMLHNFNMRLETGNFCGHLWGIYPAWKMDASQNLIWPYSSFFSRSRQLFT